MAELRPVQDHILAQLVFHWAGRCANEPGRNPKSEVDKKNLLHFDPILVYLYARIFFSLQALQRTGTRDTSFTFIPGSRVPIESR